MFSGRLEEIIKVLLGGAFFVNLLMFNPSKCILKQEQFYTEEIVKLTDSINSKCHEKIFNFLGSLG